MKKRDIPAGLKELQMAKRAETANKVQEAIDDIQNDGGVVTKKRLIELTGLSNSTFSKDHVLKVLKVNKVCQFKVSKKKEIDHKIVVTDQLYRKIEKLEQEKNLLQSKIQDKDIAIDKIKKDYQTLNENYMLILGKIHLLMKKIEMLDIDLGIDLDNL
ncbi:DUF6262 family protein [Sporosarcina sp. 6E9]|uniref:DUF6262 family protein n=1 Tax=Sporosarcina sp. 6E9 TaxID=2819235 RepID=UPI001B3154AB|nr:DUF6262 family protein [Sporosarcina sp. 6E9]